MNKFIKGFTINIAKMSKNIVKPTKYKKVGDIKEVTIFKDDDEVFKVKVIDGETGNSSIIPLTPESYELKGKLYVFEKEKDKYNHYVCHIRDRNTAVFYPGSDEKYTSIIEGIVISGNIVIKDDKQYFDYKDFVAFSESARDAMNNLTYTD